jgi:hypothetical protein
MCNDNYDEFTTRNHEKPLISKGRVQKFNLMSWKFICSLQNIIFALQNRKTFILQWTALMYNVTIYFLNNLAFRLHRVSFLKVYSKYNCTSKIITNSTKYLKVINLIDKTNKLTSKWMFFTKKNKQKHTFKVINLYLNWLFKNE